MSAKPLTDEHHRILRAASEGRLRTNDAGRWIIDGEARPSRRAREQLNSRGLIAYGIRDALPTVKGREALGPRP